MIIGYTSTLEFNNIKYKFTYVLDNLKKVEVKIGV